MWLIDNMIKIVKENLTTELFCILYTINGYAFFIK